MPIKRLPSCSEDIGNMLTSRWTVPLEKGGEGGSTWRIRMERREVLPYTAV